MGSSQFGEVYGLYDSRDGRVRYVGSTTWGARTRATQHKGMAERGKPGRLYDWLREIGSGKLEVKILKVIKGDGKSWVEAQAEMLATEKQYIAEMVKQGADLLNVNMVPGEGVRGNVVVGDSHAEVFDLARSRPNTVFVLASGLSGEDSRHLASAVRNKRGSMFGEGEKWQANVSDSGSGDGLRDVQVRFSGMLAKRKKPAKRRVVPSWEQAAREHLRKLGLSDDDIQFDA